MSQKLKSNLKKKRVNTKAKLVNLFQNKVFMIAIFFIVFSAIGGVIYLRNSSAYSYAICNGTWNAIPGQGRALGNPDIQTIFSGSTADVLVRGTDNRIYYQRIESVGGNAAWGGAWQLYPHNSAPGATYAPPTQHWTSGQHIVRVRGTDNRIWENKGNAWYPVSASLYNAQSAATVTGQYGPQNFTVRTIENTAIQYRCTR